MSDNGIGIAPFGTCLYGYGTPTVINSTAGKLFLKEEDLSIQTNAPAINAKTGDFIRDPETGIHRGMNSVSQMVYLALRTAKNSTLIPNYGINPFPKVLTDGIERKIQQDVEDALRDLTLRRLIIINSIQVSRVKQSALQILISWRNLTNNEENNFRISL